MPRKLFSGPDDRRIKRALCIVAHPDDIEFFCAGTVVMLADRGVHVAFVLATSGDKGSHDPGVDSAQLAQMREREQEAAARALGAERVEFLRRRDAELTDTLEFRGELVGCIRRQMPDVLLTFDPLPGYRQHPDHRVVGRVALDAAWPCARDRLTYPEQGPPHETAEAWCFAGPASNLEVDVSASWIARSRRGSRTRARPAARQRCDGAGARPPGSSASTRLIFAKQLPAR